MALKICYVKIICSVPKGGKVSLETQPNLQKCKIQANGTITINQM